MAMGLATTLLWVVVFVIPPAWFAYILAIKQHRSAESSLSSAAWLLLQPPPEVFVDLEPTTEAPRKTITEEPEIFTPQDWWNRSAVVSVVESGNTHIPRVTRQDSVDYFIQRLGLADDFMTRAQPDSVLAAKIFFLQMEESFDFSDAKSYLSAMGRTEDYKDIMSRKADMFDEFLNTQIMVPD